MSDPQNPDRPHNQPPPSSSSAPPPPASSTNSTNNNNYTKISNEAIHGHGHNSGSFSGQKVHYPNPPDPTNPDPATLREQWRFAIRQYSRWYANAWGTAILAGISFFALGWIIKGSNPLPSLGHGDSTPPPPPPSSSSDEAQR
ncbi:hypothetical protein TorRG33x02_294240 [Trema orientale]|uniref:Transmembrane protein n=1 Tax=Trema orientale TaxID=63057 RepID=A0A2P5C7Q9_TREOI|nr:hypothetical protein TorRG33x02_294240 [Trema orientale]